MPNWFDLWIQSLDYIDGVLFMLALILVACGGALFFDYRRNNQ